ncbi:MAG: A/G-specific adenine glycosylase [Lachnospiraceae bacterium]|nr:A/G-specific adenine glycosylase [Lachnospiraceae bacterium]
MSLNEIVKPLLAWYEKEKRILPWRASKNPYYIWISEIMLQQTRVEAVKPYFERFITALPTIKDVAEAQEEELLKLWEGLGYYSRVRNIQKAAVQVMEQYEGHLPDDYERLKGLPGIGNYTAGAVASIAYGISAPAVDGNVLRVISRIDERWDDIMKQSTRRQVEEDILAIMPADAPGEFNQALMDLGATVCLPNGAPLCEKCPVADLCKARMNHKISELPVKAPKKPRRIEERTVLVIQDGDRVAIHKRPNRGLLAGLYEFPNLEGHMTEEEVLKYVDGKDLVSLHIQPLEESKHIFSHIEWHMKGYAVRVAELDEKKQGELLFVDQKETEEKYAIPAAFHAYTAYMNIRLGQRKYEEESK